MQSRHSEIEVRIPYKEGLIIQRELFGSAEERVVLAKIADARLRDKHVLLVSSVITVPPDDYIDLRRGVSWKASFNLRAIDDAVASRRGLLILHSHGDQSPPELSSTDLRSGTDLVAAFRTAIPDSPHGTAVFGARGSIYGLAWFPGNHDPIPITIVRWISDPIRTSATSIELDRQHRVMFDRQMGLIGQRGQEVLAASTVGVAGLGGGGSHVVQQLSLLGIGTVVGVDSDVIEESNRSRLIGGTPSDVKTRRSKVKIMERLVRDTNPSVKFVGIEERFPSENSIRQLKECDVLVGCLDTLNARKELQTFAWRYLIPYVDIGLIIQNTSGNPRISGQVYDLIPGCACLWCAQFLTEGGLSRESGGLGPTYIRGSQGAAQVVSLNGVLASQAVTEVLEILTGFAKRSHVPTALQYDGISGTVLPVLLERRENCSLCCNELGRGDPVW